MDPKLFILLILSASALAAPAEDLVENLPGVPGGVLSSTHYSGYLNAGDDRYFYYWFVESLNDPVNDPVVLWLNGGPGCSSLMGSLTELGPYFVDESGTTLIENPYAWNNIANVLFLESPGCVGFSYELGNNGTCANGDNQTADSNYNALVDFYNKFPEYTGRPFYITGESYAGIYIPTLSVRIVQNQAEFPGDFQAFAIGNGIISYTANYNSIYFFARYHLFFDDVFWDSMVAACCTSGVQAEENCFFYESEDPACTSLVSQADNIIYSSGINPYNIFDLCRNADDNFGIPPSKPGHISRQQAAIMNKFYIKNHNEEIEPAIDPVCTDATKERTYLNDPDVQTALHISPNSNPWDICFSTLNYVRYSREYEDVLDELTFLNENGIRGSIYSGDVDAAVNTIGNMWDVRKLNLALIEDTRPWYVDGQVAGFVKKLNNLDFVTMKAAGHMVPTDKPVEALIYFESFLNDTPL